MKNLKVLRQEAHISQQRLADNLTLSQQSIYKYEHGLAEPDIDTICKIADYFNVTVDYLIGHSKVKQFSRDLPLEYEELQHLTIYNKLPKNIRTELNTFLSSIIDSNN